MDEIAGVECSSETLTSFRPVTVRFNFEERMSTGPGFGHIPGLALGLLSVLFSVEKVFHIFLKRSKIF